MHSEPRFSLVVPAFNEARRLPQTLDRIEEFCNASDIPWETVVVVEKSHDQTAEIAAEAAARQANFRAIINPVQRGKGYAVKVGILEARGAIRFYMDADLSVPLRFVHEFLNYFDRSPSVAGLAGNRQHRESEIRIRQSILRRSMGKGFNRLIRAVLHLPITCADTQCGFKAFRADAAKAIFPKVQTDGFAFDVEVLLLAQKLGYRIEDRPVEWNNSPESKVRIFHDSLRMLRDAVAIRIRMQSPSRPVRGRR